MSYIKVRQIEKVPVFLFKKTGKHVIDPKGRWGYKWLHRLVWRMATNLGMVRHHIEMEESFKVSGIDTKDKDIEKLIWKHIKDFVADGIRPSDMTVIIGEHHYRGLMLSRTMAYNHEMYVGMNGVSKLYNVPVIVNPFMEGVIVIPHQLIKESS